jgi:hypothetical protein
MPVAAALTAIGGISYLVEDRPATGAFWLAVGIVLMIVWQQRRRSATATPSIVVQTYAFFGGAMVVGLAAIVLAALSVVHAPLLWGGVGVACVAVNGRMLVRVRRSLRLRRAGQKGSRAGPD